MFILDPKKNDLSRDIPPLTDRDSRKLKSLHKELAYSLILSYVGKGGGNIIKGNFGKHLWKKYGFSIPSILL